ncbi:B-cell receptor CD22 [Diaphorina citri]|uniref:B-cell receptor CD22 n=1 Tax=Diaphorina citri TaxID=121845 RepID=A0A1S4ECF3_DIACI|nr:B-cell receptor CD22 [Diaphorina citri]
MTQVLTTIDNSLKLKLNDLKNIQRTFQKKKKKNLIQFFSTFSVAVPPQYPVVLDKFGRQLNSTIGPQQEGEEVILTCRVVGGKPQPLVRWLINNITVDELYEHNSGDVIENRLVWPSGNRTVRRQDLNAIFTCQAVNTDLVDPREISLVLDLYLKPLAVRIMSEHQVLDADQRYRLSCESAGSRPPAVITWYKNGKIFQLTDTKTEKHENVTRSEISFTPSTSDDGKVITCRAENMYVNSTSEKHVETTWNLRVVLLDNLYNRLRMFVLRLLIKQHITSSCSILANTDYLQRHNSSAKIVHQFLALKFDLTTDKTEYYKYQPQPVLENENMKIYWDSTVVTDRRIEANRPDIVLVDKNEKTVKLIDIAHPADHNILHSTATKIHKYQDLATEIRNMWDMTGVEGIPLAHNTSARIILSNQSLVLQKVSRQSAGTYKCSAINTKGEATSNQLKLRVKYAPICKSDRIVIVGASRSESVDIHCAVEADPPARSFKWKFNNSGETLDVGSERFSSGSRGSMLRYTPVTELDYGTLSCAAQNAIGTQVTPCLYQVVLAGKPQPPQNCSVRNETTSSVHISCTPGYDGGLPQTFTLELYSASDLNLLVNLTNLDTPAFTLEDLGLDGTVLMRVVISGVNAKGRSLPVIWDDFSMSGAHYAEDTENISSVTSAVNIVTTSIVISICFLLLLVLLICKVTRSAGCEEHMVEKVSTSHLHHLHQKSKDLDEAADPDIIPAKFEILGGYRFKSHWCPFGRPSAAVTTAGGGGYAEMSPKTYHVLPYISKSPPPTYDLELKASSSPEPVFKEVQQRTSTLKKQKPYGELLETKSDELNGKTISEKLMSNRLPESCV